MIGRIKGKVVDISLSRVIVDIQGLGYTVNTLPIYMESIHLGKEVEFWIHTAVRETDISLYGFKTQEELVMFEHLLSVSGIGPKSALAILGVAGINSLTDAVASGNTSILTRIAGIGKKTADKIVLELSGKVLASKEMNTSMKDDLDVFEALKALGYREHEIQSVIKELPKEIDGANEKIKHALKMLGK